MVLIVWFLMMYFARDVYPRNGDIRTYQFPWWEYLRQHGFRGIATIRRDIGADYTSIWYFVIVLFTKAHIYPHFQLHFCIKGMAIAGTLIAATAAFFIVRHYAGKVSWRPVLAACSVLFIPSFMCDILKTNLTDTSYLSLVLLAFLCFLNKRNWLAWLLVGFAMSFKMMGIYFAPFLFFFWLRDARRNFSERKWLELIAPVFAAVGFVLLAMPGMMAGLSFYDAVFAVVNYRVSTGLGAFGFFGVFNHLDPALSQSAPIITPDQAANMTKFSYLVVVVVLGIVFALLYSIKDRKRQEHLALNLLVISPLVCWLFMPAQHELYFSMAPVFATLLFIIYPSTRSFVVGALTNFTLWQASRFFIFGGFDLYVYLLMTVTGFLIFEIWRGTPIALQLLKERAS